MKNALKLIHGFLILACVPHHALGQGDLAVYDTFSRYSPAVFTVSVEIPEEFILQRYEDNINRLKTYQEYFSDFLSGRSDGMFTFNQFEALFTHLERRLDLLKEQLLKNNRIRGAAFAVDNNHLVTLSTVVKSATLGGDIFVMGDQNQRIPAVLQGVDDLTGVAVLRILDATLDRFVEFDRYTTNLPEASYIMTIQRPYDLPATPISGMIGGYYRQVNLFPMEKYIQTDFPLYPGNEGAPVFSPSGQLVGMIATEFHIGGWPSVTFVIPADYVVDSAREIIQTGKRERGVFPGVVLALNEKGVLVSEVKQDSPYVDELQPGDIIIGINHLKDSDQLSLYYGLMNTKPNEKIRLQILRGDTNLELVLESSRITR